MQPNQQDPYQQPVTPPEQTGNQPLPYQVPDYLHMDPATGQVKKTRNKPLIFTLLALLILLLIGSSYAYLQWVRSEPERKFYKALGIMMDSAYINREITLTNPDLEGAVKMIVDTDFSNPDTPKSSIVYDYGSSIGGITGELVTVDNEKYIGRVTDAPPNVLNGLKQNEWYAGVRNQSSTYDPDIFGVYTDTNSPVGGIIMGKYANTWSLRALQLIQGSNLYTIESTRKMTENGNDSYTHYVVKADYQKLNNLVKKMNTDQGSKLISPTITSTNTIEVVVSDKTGKITKIIENIKQGDFQANVRTTLSYPASVSVKIPDEAKTKL